MKEKFIKSTFILLVGGAISKILGMLIKMVMGRMVGSHGLGLYMMILPTFSLLIGISQFGLPIALSKLVAEDNKNNKKLFFSVIPISVIVNVILIILIIIFAPILSEKLLHNRDTYYGILAIALVIPFTSISSICRSYFFGKERMLPHVISNVVEDIVRLLVMIWGFPLVSNKGYSYIVAFLVLINVISEFFSILVLFLFLPKRFTIKRSDLVPRRDYIKESLSIGIPNTTGRLVGSVGYFLEPILLTTVLIKIGYSSSFITREYGVLSGYVMPILLLPSFFTSAISQALLPIISREYAKRNMASVKKKLMMGIGFSLVIGISMMSFFMIFPRFCLNFIYHTEQGVNYMRFLAPICLMQYIQAPLSVSLEAMGKAKCAMVGSVLGMLARTTLLVVLSFLGIGIWGLIIAISVNVLVVTLYDIYMVKRVLDQQYIV